MDDVFEIKEGDTLMIGVALAESNTAPYPVTVRFSKGQDVAFLTEEETENLIRHLMGMLIKLEARDDSN